MIKGIVLLVVAAGVVQCKGKSMPVSEACAIGRATLYSDGNFSFKGKEIDGLELRNQQKIVAYKAWYKKHC